MNDFVETVAKRLEKDSEYRKEFLIEVLEQIEKDNVEAAVNMIKYITEGINK